MSLLRKLALATLTLSTVALSGCYEDRGYRHDHYHAYNRCHGYECRGRW